jgi:anaerobic ribonucleoside-triphosphate reductase activating protein
MEHSKPNVVVNGDVSEAQVKQIIEEEKQIWAAKGKQLGKIVMTVDGDEIEVRTFEKSPIVRTRRITGYLSSTGNWNDAKRAELRDRVTHV